MISQEEEELAKKILSYGVQYSPATEIWKICQIAYLILNGEIEKIDMKFVERILKHS